MSIQQTAGLRPAETVTVKQRPAAKPAPVRPVRRPAPQYGSVQKGASMQYQQGFTSGPAT